MLNSTVSSALKQWQTFKERIRSKTVLLIRMGDFWETFNEDAEIVAKVCGVALSVRTDENRQPVKLAGVPVDRRGGYISLNVPRVYADALLRAGYSVAQEQAGQDRITGKLPTTELPPEKCERFSPHPLNNLGDR